MKRTITHGSTFSGIGAPEVAADMLGWENLFHCEINPFGRQVLDYYYPDSESYEDITKTDFSKWRGKVTVLTGGFPCQPFSYAGKRRGSEDDRYLWPFMLRCIQQVRPTWFVGENVAGITTMVFPGEDAPMGDNTSLFDEGKRYRREERYVLEEIIQSLEREGYSVQPMLIPACAVGAPHRRDRVFIIAHRNGDETLDEGKYRTAVHSGVDRAVSRGSREIQEEAEGEELQERNEIQRAGVTGVVRPENDGTSTHPEIGCGYDYQPGNGEPSESQEPQPGGGYGEETGCRDASYTSRTGLEGMHEPRSGEGEEWMQVWRDPSGYRGSGIKGMLPENRWGAFPTVSPVYRGDDGLPFPVGNLTIPFPRWKTESIKAYGNAIVVQVMYEIFRAIDEIENGMEE